MIRTFNQRPTMMNLAEQLQKLYQQYGLLPGVTIELHKELIAININNEQAQALVFLQGAQLAHYQPKGQQPVIWCSSLCDYTEGKPLRGGIPVCWPWFGDLSKNPHTIQQQFSEGDKQPAHGLVRDQIWQLDSIDTPHPRKTVLSLSLAVEVPFKASLQMRIAIGSELDCQLTVHNCDENSVQFSAALHSYLAISDCEKTHIDGLDGFTYIDTVPDDSGESWVERQQQGALTIDQETDRIYIPAPQQIQVIDHDWQRRFILESRGSTSTVVWNPWSEKAKRLSCFDDNAYREMLCIETANVMTDSVVLQPDEQHQLGVRIHHTAL